MNFLAKTFEGLEGVLSNELIAIGATNVVTLKRAVSFEGDLGVLYKANILCRSALRILAPITVVEIIDEAQLYQEVYALPWTKILSLEKTFAVDAIANSEIFTHSQYLALKTKDAIVDKFRRKFGERPNVNPISPNFLINIHVRNKTLTISLDSTGDSLHKRGYRLQPVDAPLNEVLAAGLLLKLGWNSAKPLWDPMSGSGTFAIEAAKIAQGISPHKRDRSYAFQNWNNYNESLFDSIVDEAFQISNQTNISITATDKSLKSLNATEQNCIEAGVAELVNIERVNFFDKPATSGSTIIMNPPYDERLKVNEVNQFYASIGDHLKQHCTGCEAWIFSANTEAMDHIGLKADHRYELYNGGLSARFNGYSVYEGSKIEV